MVACRISIERDHPIEMNCEQNTVVGAYCRLRQRRLGKNEEKTPAIGTKILTVTRYHKHFCYLAKKLSAVAFIVLLYAALSASAFTQPHNRIDSTRASKSNTAASEWYQELTILRKKQSSGTIVHSADSSSTIKSSSSTSLYSSTENKSPAGSNKKSDQHEWRAIFLALQLYKAAYGDLKIPASFVVPAAAPWPEPAWGTTLGQKVLSIRETGLYVDKSQKRRKQLEKLGFVWKVKATDSSISFDQIYDALVVYRSEIKPSGSLTVPKEFTVPDAEPWPENTRGLPLGKSIEKLRSKAYLKENSGAEEKLKQIGFEMDKKLSANDKRFQAVYLALERYKETYGDLLVPQPFVVPTDSSEWPEESWGLRLGARVNAIRSQGTFIKNNSERQDMLDALGFVWTPPEKESRKRGRKTLDQLDQEEKKALLKASSTSSKIIPSPTLSSSKTSGQAGLEKDADEDDTDSFLSFFDFNEDAQDSVEEESSAGEPTWGLEAGREYEGIAAKNKGAASEQDIEEEYEAPRSLGESLSAARERALESGVIEDTDSKRPTKRKREPEIPWFNDDFGGYFVFEDVVEALTLYKKGYGDFSNLTTGEFVIPVKDEPEHSFDSDNEDDDMTIDSAKASKFNRMEDTSLTEDQIEAEISRLERGIFSQEEKTAFTVANLEEVEWPEHLEGMRLGGIVERIKDGSLEVKHLPERKAQLDEIDFDWDDPKYFLDVPFEKAMCAMYAFYMVRGDMFVPFDYVMPDEDPWPRALAGYELGKAVKRIRELQNFFEAFHTEKVGLLRMIDFVWFPTLALPIDPNEPEMSSEMLLLGALGHPDYHQLDEFPMGLPEKIMGDGPFHVSDDPRQWWREWHNWDYVADIWHSMGTKDRAVALRKSGYLKMADEHEEKYGPGLFQQIDEYLESILEEISEEKLVETIGPDDAKTFYKVVDQYNELFNMWPGLTQSERMAAPGLHLTNFTLYGRRGGLPAILKVFTKTFEDNQRQRTDLSENLLHIRDTLYDYLDELADCTDMNDFELDVLWRFRIKFYLSLPLHDRFDTSNKKAILQESLGSTKKQIGEMEDQLDSQLLTYEEEDDEDDDDDDDDDDDEEEEEELIGDIIETDNYLGEELDDGVSVNEEEYETETSEKEEEIGI